MPICSAIRAEYTSLKINELSTAVADADTDLTIDLDVIVKLRDILNQAQIWIDQVNDVVPKHDVEQSVAAAAAWVAACLFGQ